MLEWQSLRATGPEWLIAEFLSMHVAVGPRSWEISLSSNRGIISRGPAINTRLRCCLSIAISSGHPFSPLTSCAAKHVRCGNHHSLFLAFGSWSGLLPRFSPALPCLTVPIAYVFTCSAEFSQSSVWNIMKLWSNVWVIVCRSISSRRAQGAYRLSQHHSLPRAP